MMKRILFVLATWAFSSLTLLAQKPEDVANLKEAVAAMHEIFQQKSEGAFVTYNDSTKTVDFCPCFLENDEFEAMKIAIQAEPSTIDGMIREMFYIDGKPHEFLTILSKAQASLNFVFKNKKTGETMGRKLNVGQIVCIPEVKDIEEDVENRMKKNPKELLRLLMKSMNEKLPNERKGGMQWERVAVENSAFVFYFNYDEKNVTVAEMKKQKNKAKEMQEKMRKKFAQTAKEKEGRSYTEMIVNANLDLVFHLEGVVTHDSLEVTVKNEELRQLLK